MYIISRLISAAGNVLNVVGCTNVRWGNDYFMGTTYIGSKNAKKEETCDDSDPEEEIVKTNLIKTVMKATIKVSLFLKDKFNCHP